MAANASEKKPGFFSRTKRYFRDSFGEMKKVVWPNRKQVLNNTGVVLVFMLITAVIIGLFDTVLKTVITLSLG